MQSRNTIDFSLEPANAERLAKLCGQFDENLRYIENFLGIEINNRGNSFQVIGDKNSIVKAKTILENIYQETENEDIINLAKVHLISQSVNSIPQQHVVEDYSNAAIHTRYLNIKPRNHNQYHYIKNIAKHDINFGIGPSGTGKTYLAVACAVAALETEKVQRIILVRPAVEAGERLGFLPGDLAQKVDPYLRPLYDALYDMLGVERVDKLIEKNIIEVAPLAYMRGRTLNEAFIILDESQNTTKEQMKMFLTRIGFNSKAVITGDITQIDLPKNENSGLRHVIKVLDAIKEIHFTFFQTYDVVRHPLVQIIVQAYENAEHDKQNIVREKS